MANFHQKTVDSFGDEWSRFDQSGLSELEAKSIFDKYFEIFPWEILPAKPEGFDMGCGTGRWARLLAPRVGKLHCIDPSTAIHVAERILAAQSNVKIHSGSVDSPGLPTASQDFGYSLGVLHHVPDTFSAIRSCAALLKPGAPFLVYLYYAFDNRPMWFRSLWRLSDILRRVICRLPRAFRDLATDGIAAIVYWPLARVSSGLSNLGLPVHSFPLSFYRDRSFYTMRTDARDRFGTPLERRFTKKEIEQMMRDAGFMDVRFSENAPYWCVVGIKV